MKMFDEINNYRKEYVYDQYIRIVDNFKDYDKITKRKMLESIYDVYSDYNNIIDICTIRELKYLEMVLNTKVEMLDLLKNKDKIEYLDEKYNWERENLQNKFLLSCGFYKDSYIPKEIMDNVKKAIKHTNWEEKELVDGLNERIIGYCKIQGSSLLKAVSSFGSSITGMKEEDVWKHMIYNKLFKYYVFVVSRDFEGLGNDIPYAIYYDYFEIEEELREQRKIQGLAGDKKIEIDMYKRIFYNDFDIENPKIKKFMDELTKLPFYWLSVIDFIKEVSMLNVDRRDLKEYIQNIPSLQYKDLGNFFKIMDEAMDEMPSGALNGFTPNEAKEIKNRITKTNVEKEKSYKKQQNACLSKKDAKLFYKIYFALLGFTNNKYRINYNVKIYEKNGINPYEIYEVVECFWKNKESIVLEFCIANPYKFTKEELKIASEFKKGIRDTFIITKYELDYAAFMNEERIYMIKGLNDNIDNIISYQDLPLFVETSIIPFKNVLVYDGMLFRSYIKMGYEFEETVQKDYNKFIKYYHL